MMCAGYVKRTFNSIFFYTNNVFKDFDKTFNLCERTSRQRAKSYIGVCVTTNHTKVKLSFSLLKAFVGKNFIMAQMVIFFFDRRNDNVGKGENAGSFHFLLFLQCFETVLFQESVKVSILRQRMDFFRSVGIK